MSSNTDELYAGTIVAFLEIKMRRDGMMSIGGTITDEKSVLAMIDTARDTLVKGFKNRKSESIIVPAYDTALTGTEHEKKLLNEINKLHLASGH